MVEVPRGLRRAAGWSWRMLVVVAAVVLVGALYWRLRPITLPVTAALFLAAFLVPAQTWLRRRGWTHVLATTVVFVGFLVVLVGVFTLVGRSFSGQFDALVSQAQAGVQSLRDLIGSYGISVTDADISHGFDRLRVALSENSAAITSGALSTAGTAIEVLAGSILALFTLFFFLYDGPGIWNWVVRLFPASSRTHVDGAGHRAWGTLTGYVRGTLLVATFDAIFITVVLFAVRVPLAVPLGTVVFFGAFVPIVGAFISGGLAVLVALVTVGPGGALIVLAGIVAVQQLESHFFQPVVLGRMVHLHPLAVVLAVGVGSLVAGIPGALISVPLTAVVNSIATYAAEQRDQVGQVLASADPEPVIPGDRAAEPGDAEDVDAAER